MGDRVLIQLKDNAGDVSPVLYAHWGGDNTLSWVKKLKERMADRTNDLDYAFARLCQIAMDGDNGNLSYGVRNHPAELMEADSHGDAGCVVVNIQDWSLVCTGGYLEHVDKRDLS